MKRLIYAAIIFATTIFLTCYSHIDVNRHCKDTNNDIKQFCSKKISGDALEKSWENRKKKMSAFVNHDFLDQLSIYIGQLTLGDNSEDENFSITQKNIETLLAMIKDEQHLSIDSLY